MNRISSAIHIQKKEKKKDVFVHSMIIDHLKLLEFIHFIMIIKTILLFQGSVP